MEEKKPLSRSAAVIAKTMYAAMCILRDNNGQMPYSQLRQRVSETVTFTEWESSPASGRTDKPRWEVNMNFYSVDYSKAGFIVKDNGTWYLTDMGARTLSQSPESIFAAAHTAFRIWKRENGKYEGIDEDVEEITEPTNEMIVKEAEAKASDGIRDYIRKMSPYDFQELAAALLRGMGYYTPFIAPKGRDGGIDVLAYENPAGMGNRLIVQVKHMPTTPISRDVISSLSAMLRKDSDTGIVVTSGTFSTESQRFAREQKNNIRLIDGEEVIRLWRKFYGRLCEDDRELMPLQPVWFVSR